MKVSLNCQLITKHMSDSNIYDVIIIGGGLSGLFAAFTILDKDPLLDVLILEATDRVGGRIISTPVTVKSQKKMNFDLGGHFISESQRHIFKLIDTLKLTIIPQSNEGLAIGEVNGNIETFTNHPIIGGYYCKYEIKWFFSVLEEMSVKYEFSTAHGKNITDILDTRTMEDFIEAKLITKSAKDIVRNIIFSTCGFDASEVSIMFYLLLCNSTFGFTNQYMINDGGGREFWIKEGAEEICKRLKNIIGNHIIHFQETVIDIFQVYLTDIVYVRTASGKTISCNNVICAIPPTEVLNINFQPPLNRTLVKIFANSKRGHAIKFIITYETKFWNEQGYSGEIFCCDDNNPIRICHDTTIDNSPALMGLIHSKSTITLMPDGNYKSLVIAQLVKYFGPAAGNPIDYVEKNWDNQFIGSPMTIPGIGGVKWFYYILANPVGRIYWAGAETGLEWYGYMNGALQSGYRAAVNVLYNIRPQAVDYYDINNIIRLKRNHKIRLKNTNAINEYNIIVGIAGIYLLYRVIKMIIR